MGPRPNIGMSLSCQGQEVAIPCLPAVLLISKFLATEEKPDFWPAQEVSDQQKQEIATVSE